MNVAEGILTRQCDF
uniref:Uncharacterized protein n=1 Tax=Rhizophora mucronata TaxID=61149 RepID=A0A2P2QBS5_RHIMU